MYFSHFYSYDRFVELLGHSVHQELWSAVIFFYPLSYCPVLLQWHPVRPIIASISSGVVSIWAQNQVENWSAFAPDFKELDENVEYEERESEFDLSDEDKSVTSGPETKDEDVEVNWLIIFTEKS